VKECKHYVLCDLCHSPVDLQILGNERFQKKEQCMENEYPCPNCGKQLRSHGWFVKPSDQSLPGCDVSPAVEAKIQNISRMWSGFGKIAQEVERELRELVALAREEK